MSLPATAARPPSSQRRSVKFGGVAQESRPSPPPEAKLIRLAREAARIKATTAARMAGISKSHWAQVESGYERRDAQYKPTIGSAATIAHMAHAVGLTPERVEAAGRADAAEVLAEILDREAASEPEDDGVDEELAESFAFVQELIDRWKDLTPAQRDEWRRRIREPRRNAG